MLETMLFDNPEIDEAVRQYCESQPKYHALKASSQAKWQNLQQALIDWADAESTRWDYISQAYYHMGLGLRQELFTALNPTAQSAP